MLVESGVLYDTRFALCVGPWASVDITVEFVTAQIVSEDQVRIVFLVS